MLSLDIFFAKLLGAIKKGAIAFSANALVPVITYNKKHNKNRFFILPK
jgi:hypothetical protein